jgi:GNAT superfamily N-acetyltransferase
VDAEPVVRLPDITDAQEIARTMTSSWRVGYRGLLSDAILDLLDDTRATAQWAGWLRDGYENAGLRAEIRVATDAAGRVVGVSTFGPDRDLRDDAHRGEVWALHVAPSHWARGYGSALLRNAEDTLAAGGRRDLALWVLEGNDRGRRFYERAGWHDDDGMKPFGDSGVYEMRYAKQV